jgi:hypothetical protein
LRVRILIRCSYSAQGYQLKSAQCINNAGVIASYGLRGADPIHDYPCILVPQYKIRIPEFEYMLPHFVWPDGVVNLPKPDNWPEYLPFPLKQPSSFELVGEALALQDDLVKLAENRNEVSNGSGSQASKEKLHLLERSIHEKIDGLKKLVNNSVRKDT